MAPRKKPIKRAATTASPRSRTAAKPKTKLRPKARSKKRAKKPLVAKAAARPARKAKTRPARTVAKRPVAAKAGRKAAAPAAKRSKAAVPAAKRQKVSAKKKVPQPKKPQRKAPHKATRKTSRPSRANYRPTDDEPFMNRRQLRYFKGKLVGWRDELVRESSQTLMNLQETGGAQPDLADRASAESDRSLELRTRDRERKLIGKIDEALGRIDDGSYGYCVESGEPIGLRRLEARPIATLSIEAQERHERREKVYRDE
jgi:DnaK suppressor protein